MADRIPDVNDDELPPFDSLGSLKKIREDSDRGNERRNIIIFCE